ncbi:predicted protein [Sclerotinia sclerotiorum 1980 UF-70]|uniref:Uncharacterized protein n=1 Tax=Sclerotinia sclerotiorum (strain ATCC 18683 / 1980 / Ss-1) TaxID=665079 RepID=A7EIA4_SCLS1|nr:predicted protein [Sclerotinia sclerotiorum 1980 UF-70]EDO02570.1 predicted protein [Sclerotinia sclerotiorum 1980 UF-70]
MPFISHKNNLNIIFDGGSGQGKEAESFISEFFADLQAYRKGSIAHEIFSSKRDVD